MFVVVASAPEDLEVGSEPVVFENGIQTGYKVRYKMTKGFLLVRCFYRQMKLILMPVTRAISKIFSPIKSST